jgi:HK97 family phage portal protein
LFWNFLGLSKIDQVEAKSVLASPDDFLIDLFGATPSSSGINVTPAKAMTCPPVRCAVQAIAEAIGQLPVHVYRRANGGKERSQVHPAYRLLHDEANDFMSAADFREQLTRDALLHGNGLALINRIDGRPIELIRLDPASVDIEPDDLGSPRYFLRQETQRREIARADILHIKAPSLNGISGESPIKQSRETIGLLLAIEAHAARLFKNGARPSGQIVLPKKAAPDTRKNLIAAWRLAHGGDNSGGTALLDDGAEYKPVSLTSVEAQLIEVWNRAVLDVARVFRVPPALLMDYSRQTWTNAEFGGQQFLTYALARWIKAWEGEIRLKLIGVDERDTFLAEFLIDDLLRSDIAARAEAYSKLIAARVLNPNEARAMENRAPYAGGNEFLNPNTTSAPSVPNV